MPIVQRRSKPVNGSVVALVAGVVEVGAVGVVLLFAGEVLLVGLLLSFDGNVPVEGAGVVAGGVVVDGVGVVGVGGVWP